MSMQAEIEDLSPSSGPVLATETGIISGLRPPRRDPSVSPAPAPALGSAWTPLAAVAWLLALTPAAVDAVRTGFALQLCIAAVQAAIIVGVLMRFAWTRRIHLLLIGVGTLFTVLLLTMISFDRSEYRTDLERFDTTLRVPVGQGAD